MIHASLHGKVPRLEKYEDILTSNVFSALRYCSTADIVVRLMQLAVDLDGKPMPLSNEEVSTIKYFFWPNLGKSEPDVLIALERVSGNTDLICVEVKYRSGKSGEDRHEEDGELRIEDTRDQLARQYQDLDALRQGAQRTEKLGKIDRTFLVYLTLDAAMPVGALEATLGSMPRGEVYWLSWRSFPDVVDNWIPSNGVDRLIRCDLIAYLNHKALRTDIKFTLEQLNEKSWGYSGNDKCVARPLWALGTISELEFGYDNKGGEVIGKYFSECQTVDFKCAQYR